MSKKSKIYVKGSEVTIVDKESKVTKKDVEDYILELNEQVEKARSLIFRNRITQALAAGACVVLSFLVLLAKTAGTAGPPSELQFPASLVAPFSDPSIIAILIMLIGLGLAIHAAFFMPSPQLE